MKQAVVGGSYPEPRNIENARATSGTASDTGSAGARVD
jgi:hypothetical protein